MPIATRLDYPVGTAMREGSGADKLDALNSCWASAFWSGLAAKLAAK